ncbi:MAG: tetratricopeptide repeat protein [Lachnospiraceae bacterium]|nr:tetratricopeptide repeat protein [Lachnospiraceae bacterium]
MSAQTAQEKLHRLSLAYYNEGLEQARVRNLTGAVGSLQMSLRCDKYNKDARNLLGLVYFATGELVSAVSEWVISTDEFPEDNIAAEYLARLQKHDSWLDRMNGCIRKYNQALRQLESGEEDVAVLSLKSCVGTFKNFLRALQLLGLLYMKRGETGRALKILKRALEIDPGNPVSQRYMQELKETEGYRREIRRVRRDKRRAAEASASETEADAYRADVIIPTYRETGMLWKMALVLVAGLILGAMIIYYGVMPEIVRGVKREAADTVISYNSKLAMKDAEREGLEFEVSQLTQDVEKLTAELETYTGDDGIIRNYNQLLECVAVYLDGNDLAAMDLFVDIDPSLVTYEGFTRTYASLERALGIGDYGRMYQAGVTAYASGRHEVCIAYLKRALAIAPDSADALYYIAHAYEKNGQPQEAWDTYDRIKRDFPAYAKIGEVEARLAVLRDYAH